MASTIVSKNAFDLLGNDISDEESRAAKLPTTAIDKKTPGGNVKRSERVSGRAVADRAPATNQRGSRDVLRAYDGNNRDRPIPQDGGDRGGRGGRGGRRGGGRGGRPDDRHARNNVNTSSQKSVGQGWGHETGDAETKDEEAGKDIAQQELGEAAAEDANGPQEDIPEEPEDKSVSYADYLAQQESLNLNLGQLNIRSANEGSNNKKWANAKPLEKADDQDFFAGVGKSVKEKKARKEKEFVDVDVRQEAPRPGGGRGRGDYQSRGDFRGDRGSRGERNDRGRGGDRGDRGGRGRGGFGGQRGGPGAPRGEFRGGARGRAGSNFGPGGNQGSRGALNTADTNAFPSLGS